MPQMLSPALMAYLQQAQQASMAPAQAGSSAAMTPPPGPAPGAMQPPPRFSETVDVNASASPVMGPEPAPYMQPSASGVGAAPNSGAPASLGPQWNEQAGDPLAMTGPPEKKGGGDKWKQVLLAAGMPLAAFLGSKLSGGSLSTGEAMAHLGIGFGNEKAAQLRRKRIARFEQEQKTIDTVHDVVLKKIGSLPPTVLAKHQRLTNLSQKYKNYLAEGSEDGKTLSPREAADLLSDWTIAQNDFELAARGAEDLRLEEQEVAKGRAAETRMVPFYQQAGEEQGARPSYLPGEPRPNEIVPPPGMDEQNAREAIRRDHFTKLRADVPQRVVLDDGTIVYLTPSQLLTLRSQDVRMEIAEVRAELARQRGEPLYPVVEGNTVVYRPRSQAAGSAAPRTLYNEAGTPSVGGVSGVSTTAPPSISEGTQKSLASLKTIRQQISNIKGLMKRVDVQGPLLGRVRLYEVEKLGGLGATQDEIRLATRLRRFLASQAFSEGGKQLTPTERKEFEVVSPSMNDTISAALVKIDESDRFWRTAEQNRLDVMPARQRSQLGGSLALEPPPGEPKVQRRLGPDGEYVYQHSFDGGATWLNGLPAQ